MTGRAVLLVVERLPYLDSVTRADLVDSVEAASGSSARRRLVEVASLVGLGLTMWSRVGTGDDRVQTMRQGVRLGSLGSSVMLAALAAATHAWPVVAAAAMLTVALAGGLTRTAVAAGATTLAVCLGTGQLTTAMLAALVLGGTFAGRPFDERRCLAGALTAAALLPPVAALVGTWPSLAWVALGSLVVVTVVALVLLGRHDPRFAVAAAVLSVATVVAEPVDRLSTALRAALSHGAIPDPGILVMCAGVLVATVVAHRSLEHVHGRH